MYSYNTNVFVLHIVLIQVTKNMLNAHAGVAFACMTVVFFVHFVMMKHSFSWHHLCEARYTIN